MKRTSHVLTNAHFWVIQIAIKIEIVTITPESSCKPFPSQCPSPLKRQAQFNGFCLSWDSFTWNFTVSDRFCLSWKFITWNFTVSDRFCLSWTFIYMEFYSVRLLLISMMFLRLTQIVACTCGLFLFATDWCSVVCLYHNIDEQLGCFRLAITNKPA